MRDVGDVVRAELTKLRKRPAVWVLLAVLVVLDQVFNYLFPYLTYRNGGGSNGFGPATPPGQILSGLLPAQLVPNTVTAFPTFAGALVLILGALAFGSEFGWGTPKTVLTQRPSRSTVVVGRLAALLVTLVVGLLVMFAAGAGTSSLIAATEGGSLAFPTAGALLQGFGTGLLVASVWATVGALLAVTFRGIALPIGLGVVWILAVENLVSSFASSSVTALQPLRDVLPGVNGASFLAAVTPEQVNAGGPALATSVGGTRSLVTLLAYVAVATAVSLWLTRHRDVT